MLKPSYMKLNRAVEFLGCDQDSALVAALEGQLKLYLLLDQTRKATRGRFVDEGGERWVPDCDRVEVHHFLYVPIPRRKIPYFMESGEIDLVAQVLSDADDDGMVWRDESTPDDSGWKVIRPDLAAIFMRTADVEAIGKQGKVKPPANDGSVSRVPRESKQLETVAALLSLWPKGKLPSGKELEKGAQAVGVTISDDSIRKVLDAARAIAPGLPPA
ncbi:hypothetical protein [Aromatoleum toluclasticum]|uniref:hypothetical protein n=1 Tax=Aromatoleum toluclasticum TaxID=92003 RepID=UPI00036D2F59|nr:hypothetical protein [Aromatoleum toluclasticum]